MDGCGIKNNFKGGGGSGGGNAESSFINEVDFSSYDPDYKKLSDSLAPLAPWLALLVAVISLIITATNK